MVTHAGPNFFLIGAPKCGTTSMARWLAEHPAVYMSPVKEPHFYSADLRNRLVTSESRYKKLFRDVNATHQAVGEASTWYLYSSVAVPEIEKAHPNCRYIVMTRDPMEMAQSLHHHNLRVLHEDQDSFECAWRLQEERAAGRSIPAACAEPAFLQYRDACSLGTQLRRLYQWVSGERVLHVGLSELRHEPIKVYRRVLDFLGVEDDGRTKFYALNAARGHRSRVAQRIIRWGGRMRMALGIERGLGLSRLNERALAKRPLSEAFRSELEEAFAVERALLGKFSVCLAAARSIAPPQEVESK